MEEELEPKVIIVEGKTDKERLLEVLDEPVEIICTYGTLGYEELERLLAELQDREVYVLADADDAGNKMRRLINREFPHVTHLYTRKMYREVATSPKEYLVEMLERANFLVKEIPTE